MLVPPTLSKEPLTFGCRDHVAVVAPRNKFARAMKTWGAVTIIAVFSPMKLSII